jgi:hypothetical protein
MSPCTGFATLTVGASAANEGTAINTDRLAIRIVFMKGLVAEIPVIGIFGRGIFQ